VSKVPFYVVGGLLAVWAVVLAYAGLSRPEFPGGLGGQRGVIAVSLVLALATIAMAVKTSTFGA
jgi:formate hydrogenlyase subunit 4